MVDSVLGAARIVGAAAAVGLLLAAAVPSRVDAAPAGEHGYWWRLQLVENGPASPPGVDPGQLYVAADAVGAEAVSAVRASVGASPVSALVLREVSSSGSPSLRACATSGWKAPAGAGPFADRPSEERCTTDVVEGLRTDGGVWRFPVGPLVTDDGILDVVIVPGVGEQSVTFAEPDEATIVMATSTSGSSLLQDDPPAASPAPDQTFTPSPRVDGTAAAREQQPARSPALDVLEVLDAGPAAIAAPIAGAPASTFEDDVVPFPAPAVVVAPSVRGSRSPLALLAVALVVGTWVYRGRAALRGVPHHPLSVPIGDRALELAGVASRLDDRAAS